MFCCEILVGDFLINVKIICVFFLINSLRLEVNLKKKLLLVIILKYVLMLKNIKENFLILIGIFLVFSGY